MPDEYMGCIMGGDWPATCAIDAGYFLLRKCFMDVRGPLIIEADSYWGFCIKVFTASHDFDSWPVFKPWCWRPVTVKTGAFIGSLAILYDCIIDRHAIVSIGSVVNGLHVPPYAMVAGNPARIIGYRWQNAIVPPDRWQAFKTELIAEGEYIE